MYTLNHLYLYDASTLVYLNREKHGTAESWLQVSRVDRRYAPSYLGRREPFRPGVVPCLIRRRGYSFNGTISYFGSSVCG